MKDIVIIYHQNCSDGFSGAWVAYKKFKDSADYIGVEHQNQPIAGLEDKEVYLIDFCYPAESMRKILAVNKKVVVLDHHIGQAENVKISTEYVFDINHSGAVIAWQYFFPKKPVLKLLQYVEDMDLWKWQLPNAKEILSALDLKPFDFKIWNKIVLDLENTAKRKKYIEEGKIINKYKNKIIERLMMSGEKVMFEDEAAYAVNSPILISEIGNKISVDKKAVGIIWHYKKGKLVVSLRGNGKIDLSKLASHFGGSGHKASSGFIHEVIIDFPWEK